jgi:RNA polymerase sigma factor (TIGR02999 family)
MTDPEDTPSAIASLMDAAERGDRLAAQGLFEVLYSELHRLARRELARPAGAAVSLGVTTLLHEAYLDIAGRTSAAFPDRARFMGYAARVMRGLIIDHANERRAQKRGGQFEIISTEGDVAAITDAAHLTAVSDALDELAKSHATLAEVVDLKFFCGFSFVEIAAMRGVSERTVQRHWDKARIYLHRHLRGESPI